MISNLVHALYITIAILLIIPLMGFIIDSIVKSILSFMVKHYKSEIAMFIANRLTFLGTVHHELAHAIFGFITGAKIIKVDLFHPVGWSLGKVTFITRGNIITKSIQLTISAIAPVVCGTVSLYLLYIVLTTKCTEIWQYCVIMFLMFSILLHTTMSKQDIKNAIKGLPVCSILIFCIVLASEYIIKLMA